MSDTILLREIKKETTLNDGRRLVLLDRTAREETYGKLQCARNLYLIGKDGNVLWQVHSDFDNEGAPFTNFHISDDIINAYRWDGGTYLVDIESGFAAPDILSR